jgi:hypothetical protein
MLTINIVGCTVLICWVYKQHVNYKYHNSQRTVPLKLVKGTKTCIFLGIKLYSSQHNIWAKNE